MNKICPPHRYRRRNLTRNPKKEPYYVYMCVEPGCSHHIPVNLAVGKEAICYLCKENRFIITSKMATVTAKPICDNCVKKTKKTVEHVEDVGSLIDKLFGE